MGKKRRMKPTSEPKAEEQTPAPRRGRWWWLPTAVLLVAAILVVGFAANVFFSRSRSGTGAGPTDKPNGEAKAVGGNRAKALIGRWLRPDGGYELHVESVASDGKITAKYLNPRPINIVQATASEKDGKLGMFVKFQDTGYPGSYYDLEYDAGRDVLTGAYYQAVQDATYEIEFTRMKQ